MSNGASLRRAWLLWALLLGALSLSVLGYQLGYNHGEIDGGNAGFLKGQQSVECPK